MSCSFYFVLFILFCFVHFILFCSFYFSKKLPDFLAFLNSFLNLDFPINVHLTQKSTFQNQKYSLKKFFFRKIIQQKCSFKIEKNTKHYSAFFQRYTVNNIFLHKNKKIISSSLFIDIIILITNFTYQKNKRINNNSFVEVLFIAIVSVKFYL